jgi:hypothetical protein
MIRELNEEYGCLEYVSGRKRDPNGGWQQKLGWRRGPRGERVLGGQAAGGRQRAAG